MEPPLDLPIDTQIIEKFQNYGNITVDDQTQIVNAINRLMTDQKVLILRDNGNDTWICLQYRPMTEEQKERKIYLYIPKEDFSWPNYNKFKNEINEEINRWLPELNSHENPAELFNISKCRTSIYSSDQFLLALVYAFGCCLNFEKCYLLPFGENKEQVRRAICKALLEKQMPTIEEMWGVQPEN